MNKIHLKAGFWYALDNISNILYMMCSSIVVARTFGPEFLGKLSHVQAVSAILMMLPILGLDQILLKYVISSKENKNYLYTNTLILQACGWFLYALLIFVYFQITSDFAEYEFIIISITLNTLFVRLSIFQFEFQSTFNSKEIFKANFLSRIIASVYVFFLIYFQIDPEFVIFYFMIQSVLFALLITRMFFRYKVYEFKLNINNDLMIRMLKESWPLILSSFVVSIYMQADVLMIEKFIGIEKVGAYSAVTKLIIPLGFVGVIISNVLYPLLVDVMNNNKLLYVKYLNLSVRVCYFFSISFFLFVHFFSAEIVFFVYGDRFAESAILLKTMSVIIVFIIPATMISKILIVQDSTKIELMKTSVAAVVNVTLNYLLIPRLGLAGAVSASIAAYVTSDLLMYCLFKKTRALFFIICKSIMFSFNPLYWVCILKEFIFKRMI